MKKITVLLLLAVAVSFQVHTETTYIDGFRGVPWGTLRADIIEREGTPLLIDGNDMMYTGMVAKKQAQILYELLNSKLVSGTYSFTNEYINKNSYIDDFKDLKIRLIKKSGEPALNDIEWSNHLYKDNPSEWGKAISSGHLAYYVEWSLNKTRIILSLYGRNDDITLMLIYVAKEQEKALLNNILGNTDQDEGL